MDVKLNYKTSPYDSRDYVVKTVLQSPLNKVDLSQYQTPIKNQGSVGSCTAFSTIALMEYNHNRYSENKVEDLYSEKFTYYVTRVKVAKWNTDDSGAYMRDAFNSARIFGACPENLFPYDSNFREEPPSEAYTEAEKNQILTFARVSESNREKCLKDVKELLHEGYCIVGGFVCFSNMWNEQVIKSGIIPEPQNDPIGGHAVCFVGYDDSTQLLKFKNSWGVEWGDKGYGYLPYSYLLRGLLSDLWTAFTQENFSNQKVIGWEKGKERSQIEKPAPQPAPQPTPQPKNNKKSQRRIPAKPKSWERKKR